MALEMKAIRLECLKLAVDSKPKYLPHKQTHRANLYMDWVMQAEAQAVTNEQAQGGDGGAAFRKAMEATPTPEDVLRANAVTLAPDEHANNQRNQRKILQNAGWLWDNIEGTYEKNGCRWQVNPLPGAAWIATMKNENTISRWIIWTPSASDSFEKYLSYFDS